MNPITIVDARMGRGKTTAAIDYMSKNRSAKRFLYITPYLDEVSRVCEQCDFDQPDGTLSTKTSALKRMLHQRKNNVATHSLFLHLDEEALSLIHDNRYALIIDESLQSILKVQVSKKDLDLILGQMVTEDEHGMIHWIDEEYAGKFSEYKRLADSNSLFHLDSVLIYLMNPRMLEAFDEVIMMTYLFEGQYQRAYMDYFGFEYRIIGVTRTPSGCSFSDAPDHPSPTNFDSLIHIVSAPRMNEIGKPRNALSKTWYSARGYHHPDIKALRNNMKNFLQHIPGGNANSRIWTTFLDSKEKLIDAKTGRFRYGFLQLGAKATNVYRNRTDVAYMVNRFMDPNISKMFCMEKVAVNNDSFALSEMLQWIWRSAIRDGREINLYIPSRRMRDLLTGWMDSVSEGNTACA